MSVTFSRRTVAQYILESPPKSPGAAVTRRDLAPPVAAVEACKGFYPDPQLFTTSVTADQWKLQFISYCFVLVC